MKKYKQVLAALLAMNLTVYVMPTGVVKISAGVESQSNEDTTEETDAGSETEESNTEDNTEDADNTKAMAATLEDTVGIEAETASDTATLADAVGIETEAASGTATLADAVGVETEAASSTETLADAVSTEADVTSESEVSDDTEGETSPSDTSDAEAEVTDEDIDDSTETPDAEVSDETDVEVSGEDQGEDEAFSDGTQAEAVSDAQTGEISTQADADTLNLEQLAGYNADTKTMAIDSNEDLILLSNCDQSKVANITIEFISVGELDVTKKSKITSGKDISSYLKATSSTTLSDEEAASDNSEAENAGQSEETEIQENSDQADVVEAEVQSVDEENNGSAVQAEESADTTENDNSQNIAVQATASRDYTYQGIGSEEHPFRGEITGTLPGNFKIDNSLFGGLSSEAKFTATNKTITWCGDGNTPMLAKTYQFDSQNENGHELPVNVKGDSSATMGCLIGTVKAANDTLKTETLKIGADVVTYTNSVSAASAAGNIGLICGTLESGNICLDGYTFPSASTVDSSASYNSDNTSAAGNTGGVIGVMKTGTTLNITSVSNAINTAVTSTNGNAGGLVGLMEQGAKIITNAEVTLNTQTVTGNTAAGGVVGMATNVTFADSDIKGKITVTNPTVKATGSNAPAGGFVGKYTLNAENLGDTDVSGLKLPGNLELNTPTLTVSNSGLAGGYFGYLDLNGKLTYTIGGTDSDNKKGISPTYTGCTAEAAAAIAGKVTSNTILSTLLIQNMTVDATNSSGNGIRYHGGLIGELGNSGSESNSVYMKSGNVEVKVSNPYADTSEATNGFGGLVGCLSEKSILSIENIVKIETVNNISQGGGLVGYAKKKSVLEISGETNLSGAKYDGNKKNVGWIVGSLDNALVYAKGDGNGNGWTYRRGTDRNTKQLVNDLGSYGQVVRLQSENGISKLSSNLISIDAVQHTVNYKEAFTMSSSEITINSEDEFALLSILWNSRGYFSADSAITNNNWSQITSKTIKLSKDIDLSGSGIASLTRDQLPSSTDKDPDDTFTGTLDGDNHKITLAIGESFGYKGTETNVAVAGQDGCGEVSATGEMHNRQGIFAKLSGTVKNLNLDGSINISNAASKDIMAGGIAGILSGQTVISNVKAEETINADCAASTWMIVGGLFGKDDKSINGSELTLEKGTEVSATIDIECGSGIDETKIFAGEILGEISIDNFKMNANDLKIGGAIKTNGSKYAFVGGLIGISLRSGAASKNNTTDAENRYINIRNVIFDGFKIDAANVTKMCGGLFGSIWSNTGVYFMGNQNTTALTVKNSTTINAPNAESVGGLAYRASGIWEIRDNGIDMQSLTINAAKDVGLLVCRGEKAENQPADGDTDKKFGALYLCLTKHWNSSYKLSETGVVVNVKGQGVFDEFVAYTAESAAKIMDMNKNGVVSIATEDEGESRAGVDASAHNTYQNRTSYGKDHETNGCSRYYYNLDQCLKEASTKESKNNNWLDSPQEMLLWSVYKYANKNIKRFFYQKYDDDNKLLYDVPDIREYKDEEDTSKGGRDRWRIGTATATDPLFVMDMKGYSYYPISIDRLSINVYNTEFRFYNEEIENKEKNNKSTQGDSNTHTQHYAMHCGMFLNYQSPGGTLTVNNDMFTGSIGKIDNSSGGLIAGKAAGYMGSDGKPRLVTVSVQKTILNGLKVTDYSNDQYAPLLINNIGSYTTLNVNGLTTKNDDDENTYTAGTAVASSLIGTVGNTSAEQINMTFQDVVLPDKKADGTNGIFSRATLLDSYSYKRDDSTSSAMYNFYKADDWNGEEHKHEVTYGKEITATTEFENLQRWYYDEEGYGDDSGLVYDDVSNKTGFSSEGYLPYVYSGYNEANCKHEIKVNQRVTDIVHGCGTYGHPYQITTEDEMKILAEYMSTGTPRKDWRVTVTKTQTAYHSSAAAADNDVTYQFNGSEWAQVKNNKTADDKDNWQYVKDSNNKNITIEKEFMRQYLLNAYYDLQGKKINDTAQEYQLNLNNFSGFGTKEAPFRGVIISSTKAKVILSGEKTGNGLIPYSYGSVVRNLQISYQGDGKTLEYTNNTTYYPEVCFGGVIGCILGGDNIIDGVTVDVASGWLTLSGNQKHLIQVGGYVGSVSGGGVIFRNMTADKYLKNGNVKDVTGIQSEDKYSYLYINPYVGRVLDGFAFYEAESVQKTLDNTGKNYKINTLVTGDTKCVSMNGAAVTVDDAQGLLVLSAIVNSGAASNGNNYPFSSAANTSYSATDGTAYNFAGKYGKVRKEKYNAVGNIATDDEIKISQADDQKVPGTENLPYLIQAYCGANTGLFGISSQTGLKISLKANGNFDMRGYGNGYQGIAARYVSYAVRGQSGSANVNKPEGIVPEVMEFDGNNNEVLTDMRLREYTDDDFHAASAGGLFNILRMSANGKVSNVKAKNSSISLKYYNSEGKEADVTGWDSYKENVGLGEIAGSVTGYVTGYTGENNARDIQFSNIQLDTINIESPASAGGIIGNSGRVSPKNRKDYEDTYTVTGIDILLQPENGQYTYGIAFDECTYGNLTVKGEYAAGGFVGYLGNAGTNPRSSVTGKTESENVSAIIGQNSAISAADNSSWAGGFFGYVGTRMFINMADTGKTNTSKVILQDVSVSAGKAAGGCIGYIDNKCYGIHNVTVRKTESNSSQETSTAQISLNGTATGTFYAGGIVGYAKGEVQKWTPDWTYAGGISNCSTENIQVNDAGKATAHDYSGTDKIRTSYIAGGIAGQIAGGETKIDGCIVTAGKIYGSVASGITGQTDSLMTFNNCSVNGNSAEEKTEIKGFSTAGGILGFWNGGNAVTIQNCKVRYIEIEGKDWGVGALIGDADSQNQSSGYLYLFDSSVQDSKVIASGDKDDGGGRWPCVGGITGNLRNVIKASNVLFSGLELNAEQGKGDTSGTTGQKGLLFGNVTNDSIAVNIAGISIQNIPDSNTLKLTGSGSVRSDNDYIAFADYSGSVFATDKSGKSLAGNSTDLLGAGYKQDDKIKTDIASPYTVTSPKSTLSLYESESSTDAKYLYGDGVSWTSSGSAFTVKAQEIYENRSKDSKEHYNYNNIPTNRSDGTDFSFNFTSAISTFAKNNQTTETGTDNKDQTTQAETGSTAQTSQTATDFPVLQIGSGSADIVTDYLDILTNGAFSAANKMNEKDDIHVAARSDIYEYKNGKFVKASDSTSQAFEVNTTENGTISFSTTTDYDNGKNRFNLLTVTFTEGGHHYNVFVPVLVRRMLEVNFTATLSYGTNFRSETYKELKSHVLESFGSSITGYLTYTYNSDADGKYTDYGWQSYINAGGDVSVPMQRKLLFEQGNVNLPRGTQLSLVDCRTGRVYYYTVEKPAREVELSDFTDSAGNAYEAPSIAELMQAEAESNSAGEFVEVDKGGKPSNPKEGMTYEPPTVRIRVWNEEKKQYEYKYYRRAMDGETGNYTIKVDESNLKDTNNKSTVSENYYLVITVPKNTESDALNGSLQTSIENKGIEKQIHYKTIQGDPDNHNNKASTYLISTGYQQSLSEENISAISKKMSEADTVMKIDAVDEITFPTDQAYLDNNEVKDELYQRFVGSLQKTVDGKTSAEQFPKGTTGTAHFYVYTKKGDTKNYYKYEDGKWSEAGTGETVAASYEWTSDGGNMELPLADETITDLISLQGVRKMVMDEVKSTSKTGTFYVEVRMDASIPSAGLDVIPESKASETGQPTDYTKLIYSSQISTVEKSLSYSTNRVSLSQTTTSYYREEPEGTKLTYEANQIGQLGINLLDLQYLDTSEEHSLIDTTALYDLSSMKNLDDALKNSSGIKFTLSLSPKDTASGNLEKYQSALDNASEFLSVDVQSPESGTLAYSSGSWSWTVPKNMYWDEKNNTIATSAIFNGTILTQAIQLKVNVSNVESSNHLYSNYKVDLSAEIVGSTNSSASDNIIYTLAKINPKFQ